MKQNTSTTAGTITTGNSAAGNAALNNLFGNGTAGSGTSTAAGSGTPFEVLGALFGRRGKGRRGVDVGVGEGEGVNVGVGVGGVGVNVGVGGGEGVNVGVGVGGVGVSVGVGNGMGVNVGVGRRSLGRQLAPKGALTRDIRNTKKLATRNDDAIANTDTEAAASELHDLAGRANLKQTTDRIQALQGSYAVPGTMKTKRDMNAEIERDLGAISRRDESAEVRGLRSAARTGNLGRTVEMLRSLQVESVENDERRRRRTRGGYSA